MRPGLIALLVALGAAALGAQPACRASRFGGEVSHGQAFEHALSPDLVFRLAPAHPRNPPGWTIQVRSRALPEPEDELSWVVTPPYRFWNPRYLDTSYGKSAREAVAFTPREFEFVATAPDYQPVAQAVRKLLWSAGIPETDLAAARRVLDTVRRATGRLNILASRVDDQATGGFGRIEWLRFEVEVCLP